MSTETINRCDRCGKKFRWSLSKLAGYFLDGIKRKNKIKFRILFHGNPDGYLYSDHRVDLCEDCTRELLDFLYQKENEHGKRN